MLCKYRYTRSDGAKVVWYLAFCWALIGHIHMTGASFDWRCWMFLGVELGRKIERDV